MMRNIGGALLGLAVWFAGTMALFTLMWLALGAERSFHEPSSWEVSAMWAAGALAAYAVTGIGSGLACGKVAPAIWASAIVALLVLSMGVWKAAVPAMDYGIRPDDVGMQAAALGAKYPSWAAWLNAIVGPLGILYGASKARRSGEDAA